MKFFFYSPNKVKVKYLTLSTLQELIPTSDSNVVVSLTRLFEVLLCNVLENDPTSKHIRIWIMVGFTLNEILIYSIKCASGNDNYVKEDYMIQSCFLVSTKRIAEGIKVTLT